MWRTLRTVGWVFLLLALAGAKWVGAETPGEIPIKWKACPSESLVAYSYRHTNIRFEILITAPSLEGVERNCGPAGKLRIIGKSEDTEFPNMANLTYSVKSPSRDKPWFVTVPVRVRVILE